MIRTPYRPAFQHRIIAPDCTKFEPFIGRFNYSKRNLKQYALFFSRNHNGAILEPFY